MRRPDDIRIIVATDCGSTTTKAILIELIDGEYRQTFRGESPTTVEEPLADVTIGVVNAISELQELAVESCSMIRDESSGPQPRRPVATFTSRRRAREGGCRWSWPGWFAR
ncbi:MAG: glutamate mutase L [Planctomycetaceae bacterium]